MPDYNIEEIRRQLRNKMRGKERDPNELKPPKVAKGKIVRYRLFILPPVLAGDKIAGGKVASRSMDTFFVPDGQHWINKRPYTCPRITAEAECCWCQTGFDLMEETKDRDERSKIAKRFMPQASYKVNTFLTKDDVNPEDCRGANRWYSAPKTVADLWEQCISRDNWGRDKMKPDAYGVFFNEAAALLFTLEVTGADNGDYNDYKKSEFFCQVQDDDLARYPIGNSPTEIQAILDNRYDLYSLITPANPAVLQAELDKVLNGVETTDEQDEVKTSTSVSVPSTAPVSSPAPAPVTPPVTATPAVSAPEPVTTPAPASQPAATEAPKSSAGDIASLIAKLKNKP